MSIRFTEIKINMNFRNSMRWPVLTCRKTRTQKWLDLMSSVTKCDSLWVKSWNHARTFIGQCCSIRLPERLILFHRNPKSSGRRLRPKKWIRLWRKNLRISWTCASKSLRCIVKYLLPKKLSMMMSLRECTISKIKNWKNNSEDKELV
jgi:hypothetical protein